MIYQIDEKLFRTYKIVRSKFKHQITTKHEQTNRKNKDTGH